MKESVSALMDGELSSKEAADVIATLGRDEALREVWDQYHLIGEVMRANPRIHTQVGERVSASLADEPTVLAPRRLLRTSRTPVYALAASVTFAACVGWYAWQQPGAGAASALLAQKAQPVAAVPVESPYMQAHQDMVVDANVARVSLVSTSGAVKH